MLDALSEVPGGAACGAPVLALFMILFFFISLRGWVKGLLTFSHVPAIRISHKFLHKPGCSQQWYNPVKFGPVSEDFQDILKPDSKLIICPILSCDTSN